MRGIAVTACPRLLLHVQICSSPLLGLVGLTAQLFAKASVTQIIIIAENAFDFFLVAVDDILNPLTRKSFDEDNEINF